MVMMRLIKFAFHAFNTLSAARSFRSTKLSQKYLNRLKVTKSFKPLKSDRAEKIYQKLSPNRLGVMHQEDKSENKKSLAWVLWAFKKANEAEVKDGISVHDVSALLYRAANVELYPINISRVVHQNTKFIAQVSQEKKTKRYLLTPEGQKMLTSLAG